MNILLTNDDGIYAHGLNALYDQLKKVGKVTIVAPDSERSSVGHGITLAQPLWLRKVKRKDGQYAYGISGTPADCVKIAIGVILKKKPDLVVSGINLGPNCGYSVFYSGTIAGAREGAMMNIPSMAISLATFNNPDFSCAALLGARFARMVIKHKLPPQTFLNINVPAKKRACLRGIKIVRQGIEPIHSQFLQRRDPYYRNYYWMSASLPSHARELNGDTQALSRGYITVTPIHCDLTDYSFLEKLTQWGL